MVAADLSAFLVNRHTSLHDTLALIDANGAGIAVVAEPDGTFIDLATDGDIRRAILSGMHIDEPIQRVLDIKRATNSRAPITVKVDDPPALTLLLMERLDLHQMPVLDALGRIQKVVHRDSLAMRPRIEPGHSAVVMAGGFGTRLRPLTERTPKPMLKVAGTPILEYSIRRLARSGIERIYVTVHYKSDQIVEHFGDGRRFGVDIEYVHETVPLGTAGSVGAVDHGGKSMVVMNGDVITDCDFRALVSFAASGGSDIAMAVTPYEVHVPYGVVGVEGTEVTDIQEKPVRRFYINSGIYVVSPAACALIPKGVRFDMTDLARVAVESGRRVNAYPMVEYWRDVGTVDDLQRVSVELSQNRWLG